MKYYVENYSRYIINYDINIYETTLETPFNDESITATIHILLLQVDSLIMMITKLIVTGRSRRRCQDPSPPQGPGG